MNTKVNLMKARSEAIRYGASGEGLKFSFLNPWFRYRYRDELKKTPHRSMTCSDAEQGMAGGNMMNTSIGIHHASTAPADLQRTPIDRGDDTYDSQATTTGSPTTGDGDGAPRHRRRKVMGIPLGRSHSEQQEEDNDDKLDRPKPHFTFKNQIQRTILASPLNILLLAAPAGIIIWALKIPGPAVFVVNFIAIIPLAAMLSDATEEVAKRTGETLGGLINATFG